MTDGLTWAIRGIETFVIVFIIGINVGIFVYLYPNVLETNCELCTYEKDFAIAMIFIVPIPSAFLIWAIVNSNLDDHMRELEERS